MDEAFHLPEPSRGSVLAFVPKGGLDEDYVVVSRASGKVVWQTWRRKSVERLDGELYEVVRFGIWAKRVSAKIGLYGK